MLLYFLSYLLLQSIINGHTTRACNSKPIPDESFLIMDEVPKMYEDKCNYSSETLSGKMIHVHGNRHCPRNQDSNFCPHYYVMNYDVRRSPSQIVHARCACTTCRGSGKEGNFGECRPIFHYRFVREKSMSKKAFEWKLRGYPIACECQIGTAMKTPRTGER